MNEAWKATTNWINTVLPEIEGYIAIILIIASIFFAGRALYKYIKNNQKEE